MRLRDFIEKTGASLTKLSAFSGVSRSMLVKICEEKNEPSVGLALKIERATGGAVTLYDLVLARDSKKQTQTKKNKDGDHHNETRTNPVEHVVHEVNELRNGQHK